ncbi:MAG: hypothetical protein LBL66_03580 [Clostridiales bacterium]|jgi:hypothetical protein|nr:hypothetical protein [Clostridiales bacterium]
MGERIKTLYGSDDFGVTPAEVWKDAALDRRTTAFYTGITSLCFKADRPYCVTDRKALRQVTVPNPQYRTIERMLEVLRQRGHIRYEVIDGADCIVPTIDPIKLIEEGNRNE